MAALSKVYAGENRTMLVCVDEYEAGNFSGRLNNSGLEVELKFSGVMQLLIEIDRLLDEQKFPQSFETKREFAGGGASEKRRIATDRQDGAVATFAVKVLFRQNASWQGTISWLDGGSEESFRSVLEMLFLINSALSAKTKDKSEK